MKIFSERDKKILEITPGEKKRHELSRLAYNAANIIQKPGLRTEWELLSNGSLESCCHIVLGRKGNVISLYTPAERGRKRTIPRFDAVEVYLLDREYERLAYALCNELLKAGYEVGIRRDSDCRVLGK